MDKIKKIIKRKELDPVEKAVEKAIELLNRKFGKEYRIYVGLSAGADSMALAGAIDQVLGPEAKVKYKPTALHLDHMLRGDDSDKDRECARDWAYKRGWAYIDQRSHVSLLAQENGESIETMARRVRYDFYERVMKDQTAPMTRPVLFLAHHIEDQSESILLHLFRGSGSRGVTGMDLMEERDGYSLIRPLLSLYKEDLIAYNKKRHILWREDVTNYQADVVRNYLRLKIIPEIKENINPSLHESLSRFAQIVRVESDYIDRQAEKIYTLAKSKLDRESLRNRALLRSSCLNKELIGKEDLALQRRIISLWLSQVIPTGINNVSLYNIETIRNLFFSSSGKLFSLYGIIFLSDYRAIHAFKSCNFIERNDNKKRDLMISDKGVKEISEGVYEITNESLSLISEKTVLVEDDRSLRKLVIKLNLPSESILTIERLNQAPSIEKMKRDSLENIVYIDPKDLDRIIIRRADNKDAFKKWRGGSEEIRKMYNEWHLPQIIRDRQLVLTDGNDILWAIALARSAVRPAKQGQEVIRLDWRLVDNENRQSCSIR